jgi:hypothetical protein
VGSEARPAKTIRAELEQGMLLGDVYRKYGVL